MATRNVSMIMTMEDKASSAIRDVNKRMDNLVNKSKSASDRVNTMSKSLEDMGKKMGSAGKKMTKGLTLPLAGVGTAAIATVSSFDDSMANVQKISGATGEEFDDLRSKAMELGSTTAFSASEAAEGMGVLSASGMKANEVMAVSEDMFNLMSAGSIDANTSASILTNTMSQFNLSVEDSGYIVDTFAATSSAAKIGVDALEKSMGQSGTTFSGMNMSIVESTAALGQLTNAGVEAGRVGTIANAMGREIKASAVDFQEMGIEVYDSEGKLKDMGSVMAELEDHTAGMSDAQRDAALSSVFSGQAMEGATAWLSKGSDAYSKLTDEIVRESNAAETMAAIQEDTIGGAFRAVKSATEGFMIEVGDILKGPIQSIAKWVSDLANSFGKLSSPAKKAIVGIGLITAAMGPALVAGSKLISGASKAGGVFKKVSLAISGVSAPMIAGVAAAALLGGAIYRLWSTNEEFRDGVLEVWNTIQGKLGEALGRIKNFWSEHGEEIKSKVTAIFDRLGSIISGAFEIIVEVVGTMLNWIGEFWSNHGETITNIASMAWDTISGVVDGAMQIIQGVISVVLGVIQGDWSSVWGGVQEVFEGVMTAVKSAWSVASEVIGRVIEGTVNAITGKFHSAIDKVREAWKSLKEFMKNPIKGTVNAARKGAGWVKDKVTSRADGSHRTGAYNIPFDGYQGIMHKGEMVLTKGAATIYRALGGTEKKVPVIQPSHNVLNRNEKSTKVVNSYMNSPDKDNAPNKDRSMDRQPQMPSFSPTVKIEVQGNASEDTVDDLELRMKRVFEREQEKFWAKLALQG